MITVYDNTSNFNPYGKELFHLNSLKHHQGGYAVLFFYHEDDLIHICTYHNIHVVTDQFSTVNKIFKLSVNHDKHKVMTILNRSVKLQLLISPNKQIKKH